MLRYAAAPAASFPLACFVSVVIALAGVLGVAREVQAQEDVQAQEADRITLRGRITSAATDAPLVGATVFVPALEAGTSTDGDGRYRLRITPGTYEVVFNYVGYRETRRTLDLRADRTLDVALDESTVELEGVTVTEEAQLQDVRSVEMGVTRLTMESLEQLPTFLGEVDVVRSLLLLPGVSTVGEGASGFNVRGGNVDQNLILFDGAPIFYPSHLLGFFSLFNPSVVQDATLYRGGIPARYGGRVSSVLDIRQKQGSTQEYQVDGSLGLIASRLAVDGPIVNDRTSLLVGGRGSYVDWVLNRARNDDVSGSSAGFYDLNAGLTHRISDRDDVKLSGYYGYDRFNFITDTLYTYRSATASARWNHVFGDDLLTTVTASLSDYGYDVEGQREGLGFVLESGVQARSLQGDLTWNRTDTQTLEAGVFASDFRVRSNTIAPTSEASSVSPQSIEDERGVESAVYASYQWAPVERLSLRGGLRVSAFQALGPRSVYAFEGPGGLRDAGTLADTTRVGSGSVIEDYYGLEPRFSARYLLSEGRSVKASYNRTRQYVHLVSNTTAVQPIDIWKPSDEFVRPQIGDQVSLGYFQDFEDGNVTSSVEVYYKRLQNVVDFKPGAELLLNPLLTTDLLIGEGRAYGAELLMRRRTGRFTGWLSYTYSRSERRVDGALPEQQINDGDWYPSNFDRPHDLSVVFTYQENPRVSWNLNFTYKTGRPITYPVSKFTINDIAVANFSTRNQFRIPDFHRLDFSLKINFNKPEKTDGWRSNLTFSLYNLYARKNPYSIYFTQTLDGKAPQAFRLATLGTIFPSVTYSFKF